MATTETLIISHLFPNGDDRQHGVFVQEKAKALSRYTATTVIAPVSRFPFFKKPGRVALSETVGHVEVHHPRYLALPNALFRLRWVPYYHSLRTRVHHLPIAPDAVFVEWVYPDAFAAMKIA